MSAGRKPGTFAWRLWMTRAEAGMSQYAVVDKMKRRFNYEMTYAAYNKHETGQTENPKLQTLAALSKILGCSVDYLVTGEEPEAKEEKFLSEEANRAGQMIDNMLPENRRYVLVFVEQFRQMDNEQRSKEIETAHLLTDNVNLMSKDRRTVAAVPAPRPERSK